MADELTVNFSMEYKRADTKIRKDRASKKFSVSGSKFTSTVQGVGTSSEAIGLGDVAAANLGFAFFSNLDASNAVHFLLSGASNFAKLKAQEFCFLRLEPSITLHGIADTAEVLVELLILND